MLFSQRYVLNFRVGHLRNTMLKNRFSSSVRNFKSISARVVTGLESGLHGVGFISKVGVTFENSLFGVDRARC